MKQGFYNSEEISAFNKDEKRRILLKGGIIISMDEKIGDLIKGDVLVEGKKIAAVGKDLSSMANDDTVVLDMEGRIIMPGLQDTHRHCWESTLKRLFPDCQNLAEYRQVFNISLGRAAGTPEVTHMGNLLAAYSCIDSGITNVHDIFQTANSSDVCDAAIDAMLETGIRFTHVCPKFPTADWEKDLRRKYDKYFSDSESRASLRIGGVARAEFIPAIVIVTGELLDLAREMGIGVTCDAVFGENADAYFRKYADILGEDILMTHCHDLNDYSWKVIADKGVAVSLTPTSDSLYGSGCAIAPVQQIMDFGIKNVGLGVDTETNVNSDLFAVMQDTAIIQRTMAFNKRFHANGKEINRGIDVKDIVYYATLGGAKATMNGRKVGSLTPGKYADITILNTLEPNNIPLNNVYGAIVYSSSARDVETVMVEGKILKYDSKLVGVDLKELNRQAVKVRDTILERAEFKFDPFNPIEVDASAYTYMGELKN